MDQQVSQYLNSIGASVGASLTQAAQAAEQGGAFPDFVQQAGLGHLPEHQQRLAFAAATLPLSGALSEHAAQAVFDAMKALSHEIPFHLVTEGCYARAQLMGDAMRSIGLDPGKAWALPGVGLPNYAGAVWDYHVAPTIQVRAAWRVETRVVDPAVAITPLLTKEWMSTIGLQHHLEYPTPLTPAGLAAAQGQCAAEEPSLLRFQRRSCSRRVPTRNCRGGTLGDCP